MNGSDTPLTIEPFIPRFMIKTYLQSNVWKKKRNKRGGYVEGLLWLWPVSGQKELEKVEVSYAHLGSRYDVVVGCGFELWLLSTRGWRGGVMIRAHHPLFFPDWDLYYSIYRPT